MPDPRAPSATPLAGAGRTVFISYASQDVAVADKVCAALESAGIACWIAPRDVRAGEPYAAAIVGAINACRLLVLVLTKSAIDSSHVRREVERASSKQRAVLSIRLDDTELPPELEYFLSSNHWLDASRGPLEQILPALIEAARGRSAIAGAAAPRASPVGADGARGAPSGSVASARSSARQPLGSGAKRTLITVGALVVLAFGSYYLIERMEQRKSSTPVGAEGAASMAPANDKSIAVLPFTDMSEKKDQEYFSDGMAEEIIDLLVKVPELKVPARTSSFYFKGKSTKIPDIARELGVAHVLEGSVRKSGNHLRVTAQLVRADNGYHLWSETYDRQLEDVFKTQDEIAEAVVKALKVSLLAGETPRTARTTNSEAYALYLQARALTDRSDSDGTLKGYADLRQAVVLDPKFALAWAALAEVLTRDNVDWTRVFSQSDPTPPGGEINLQDWGAVWAQARAAAHAAAEQAIQLGPNLAESHAAMAQVLAWLDWDWVAADAQVKTALELEPGNTRIMLFASDLAVDLGHVSEGLDLARRAEALDPLGHASRAICWAQFVTGSLSDAQVTQRRSIELYPKASGAHYRMALILLALGEPESALAEFERETATTFRAVGGPLALDALGRHSEADQAMAIAEQKYGIGMAYQIAYLYASRKDLDRAFHWLERAYQQKDGGLADMKTDPMLKNLRQDPRFKALLRKMRLPE